MSNISIRLTPENGLDFSVTRKNLKWAYQSGSDYFADFYDEEIGVERSVQISQTTYEDLVSTYNLPILTAATADLDCPVAVGDQFVISDANIVIGNYAQSELDVEIPAVSTWDSGTAGTGSFTLSNSSTTKVWTGVASSVTGDSADITYSFTGTEEAGTATITLGTIALGGKTAGTDFDFEVLDQDNNVLFTFANGDLVTGNSVDVPFTAGVTGLKIKATALTTGDNISTTILRVASVSVSQESGTLGIEAGYNTQITYNFKGSEFNFGVDELLADVAGGSIWLNVGTPLAVNYSPWTLGVQGLLSAGTRLSLVEDPEDANRCYTRIDAPQALMVVQWDNDVDYIEDYWANL